MENELPDSYFNIRKRFYEESKRKAEKKTIWEDKKQEIRIVFNRTCKKRPIKKIVKELKRCPTVVILGTDKTPQMAREESIARAMGLPIWYRPSAKNLEELLGHGKEIFPKHQ
jgi:vacuolar-type H+-ATPase subunit F/Vma7